MLVLGVFISYCGVNNTVVFSGYILCAIVGIVFAEEQIFEKLFKIIIFKGKINNVTKLILGLLSFFIFMVFRGHCNNIEHWYYIDVFAPIILGG